MSTITNPSKDKERLATFIAKIAAENDESFLERVTLCRSTILDFITQKRLPTKSAIDRISTELGAEDAEKLKMLWNLATTTHIGPESFTVCSRRSYGGYPSNIDG